MRKSRLFYGLVIIVLLAFIFTACSKKANENGTSSAGPESDMAAPQEAGAPEAAYDSAGQGKADQLTNTSVISSKVPEAGTLDKIIRRINMNVETQEFDDLINTIDQQINSLGGYVESSQISGQRYYYKDNSRYGNIVARIPKDKLDDFINNIYDNANVINKSESTENVTLQYIDADSHKKALDIEQERLLALLGKTETLEDILVLESRLSDLRYQLQNYEAQLRTYDNLVEYSTVTLNIQEVERMSNLTEGKGTVWDRISKGFGDTIYKISEGVKNFMVWFVVNLPYLIIWAGIIILGIFIGKRVYRRKHPRNPAPSLPVQEEKKDN